MERAVRARQRYHAARGVIRSMRDEHADFTFSEICARRSAHAQQARCCVRAAPDMRRARVVYRESSGGGAICLSRERCALSRVLRARAIQRRVLRWRR